MKFVLRSLATASALLLMAVTGAAADWKPAGPITKLTKDMISGVGEMYDMSADPHEMTNLYDDPAHAAMRADLEALINSRADDMIPLQPQVGLA